MQKVSVAGANSGAVGGAGRGSDLHQIRHAHLMSSTPVSDPDLSREASATCADRLAQMLKDLAGLLQV